MIKHYVGTLAEVQATEAQICTNAGIPNGAGTLRWSVPTETIDSGVYAIEVPTYGWNGCTYAQMVEGIIHPESENVVFPNIEE